MPKTLVENYIKQFEYYKQLAEKAMTQLDEAQLLWRADMDSNNIATIVKHLNGNMLSRWTDFLITDGEKTWRQRDAEFEVATPSRTEIMKVWEEGWHCLMSSLCGLQDDDLERTIFIRNQAHTVREAINRQLAHYPYHVGQIVFIAKVQVSSNWQALSIAKGQSDAFNAEKFSQKPSEGHYTDEWMDGPK